MTTLFLFIAVAYISVMHAGAAEDTHLVTMTKPELMEIIDCVSKSKNPVLCEKFRKCEMMMPQQVTVAYQKCQKECMGREMKRCTASEPLFPSPEIPSQIFDCIVKNTNKLTPEEDKKMVEFENCSRALYKENCKVPK